MESVDSRTFHDHWIEVAIFCVNTSVSSQYDFILMCSSFLCYLLHLRHHCCLISIKSLHHVSKVDLAGSMCWQRMLTVWWWWWFYHKWCWMKQAKWLMCLNLYGMLPFVQFLLCPLSMKPLLAWKTFHLTYVELFTKCVWHRLGFTQFTVLVFHDSFVCATHIFV